MSQQNSLKNLSFYEHIDELRARLMRALMVFFIGFIGLYFVTEPIMEFMRQPLFNALPEGQQKLYFTSLFENFLTHLKIAGYASVFVFSPYFFWEIWAFVAPGLYPRERRLVIPFITMATVFFLSGAAFAYFVLFPVGFKYFVTYGGPAEVPLLTIDAYYSTCLKLMLLFGMAFELPVLIILLGYLGLIDAKTLKLHRKTATIGITIASALFAPPDALSMVMLGAPLILMYEGSIWVVQWLGVRRAAEEASTRETTPSPLVGKSRP